MVFARAILLFSQSTNQGVFGGQPPHFWPLSIEIQAFAQQKPVESHLNTLKYNDKNHGRYVKHLQVIEKYDRMYLWVRGWVQRRNINFHNLTTYDDIFKFDPCLSIYQFDPKESMLELFQCPKLLAPTEFFYLADLSGCS